MEGKMSYGVEEVGSIFSGMGNLLLAIGAFFVLLIMCYMFFQWTRSFKINADSEEHYFVLERTYLKKFAEKNNIDLDKEIELYREISRITRKTISESIKDKIRKELEEEYKKELKKK